jgi:uncharacterized protein (TIGR02266 family)
MDSAKIHNLATEETFPDGQIIFKEGSPGDWIYIIQSGSVEISKYVRGETKIIEVLNAGEVFGELGFIGGIKRTATAKAVGLTTLGIIDRGFLDDEFNKLSGQFRAILVAITHRFKKMLDRACDYSVRAEPRVPKALSLVFKDHESFVRAYTGDISSGGLSIRTENPLPPGHQFHLKLQVPGRHEPIQAECEVVWSRKKEESAPGKPSGMGVKFCEIPESDLKFLKQYVSEASLEK